MRSPRSSMVAHDPEGATCQRDGQRVRNCSGVTDTASHGAPASITSQLIVLHRLRKYPGRPNATDVRQPNPNPAPPRGLQSGCDDVHRCPRIHEWLWRPVTGRRVPYSAHGYPEAGRRRGATGDHRSRSPVGLLAIAAVPRGPEPRARRFRFDVDLVGRPCAGGTRAFPRHLHTPAPARDGECPWADPEPGDRSFPRDSIAPSRLGRPGATPARLYLDHQTRLARCPGRGSNPHGGCPPEGFKPSASANSATRAGVVTVVALR